MFDKNFILLKLNKIKNLNKMDTIEQENEYFGIDHTTHHTNLMEK